MKKAQNDLSDVSSETTLDSSRAKTSDPGEPTTMEELLAQTGYELHGLKKGQQVTGVVSSIAHKEILIDIGAKTEALVLEKDSRLFAELKSTLSLGASVNAVVISAESDYGMPIVSLRRQLLDKNWSELRRKKEQAESLEATVVDVTRGGLLVEALGGLRGFIPFSHLDSQERPETLIGKKLTVFILDLDRSEQRIVLSQKGARIDPAKIAQILGKIEIGKEYEGTVSGITNFGIFVKIFLTGDVKPISADEPPKGAAVERDEVEGLAHISEISWEKVEDLSKLFKIGDIVRVLVIGVDKTNLKLNFSLKQLTKDPWAEVANKYAAEQQVKGIVSRVSPFGVFVTLDEGIEGLIHKSKLPGDRELAVGEKIACVVESVDREKRRIALLPLLKAKPVGYR